jgi:hypothetical protein
MAFPPRAFPGRVFPSRVFPSGGGALGPSGPPPSGGGYGGHLFPQAVRAQLDGHTVKVSLFYEFDFRTVARFVWDGDGPVERQGVTWGGLRMMGSLEGWDADINGTAPQAVFTLSGVDAEILTAALKDHRDGEIAGHRVTRYIGFWQKDEPGLVPLDNLLPIGWRTMQRPEFVGDGPSGQRQIRVPAETPFVLRSRAPWGMLTDRDQQARYAGDLGLEQIPMLQDKVERWPRL